MDRQSRIESLRKLADEDPSDALTFFMLGTERLRDGQSAAAADDFLRCLEIDPRHTAAVRLLADAYRQMGEVDQARETYQRAIEVAEQTGDLQVAKEARALLRKLEGGT
jgi:Tfp pilus assembly protein PilF